MSAFVKPLIVANWKMNLSTAESVRLTSRIHHKILVTTKAEVVLCPSFVDIAAVKAELKALQTTQKKPISLGAQNVSQYPEGPYTGEIAASQLKGLVSYVIEGHSERRLHFGETSAMEGSKLAECLSNNLKPILCVGETLIEREDGLTLRTILSQLEEGLTHVTAAELPKVTIAYEPVWAIGSGEIPMPADANTVAQEILAFLQNNYPRAKSYPRILYGGSVNSSNSRSFLNEDSISGLLIGGASLNYAEFSSIVNLTSSQELR